jgi:hypothetical protein
MEIRFEKDAEVIGDPQQQLDDFAKKMQDQQAEWVATLQENPDEFVRIEAEVQQAFAVGGGRWLAALMHLACQVPSADEPSLPGFCRRREKRTVRVQLLCGLLLWVTTWYVAPRRRKNSEKTEQLGGLFPQLAAMGFGKGCSPGLQYTVARIVALSPSIKVAQKELRRQGLKLDYKTVRRIAEQLGTQLLALRQRELLAWRAGRLPAGQELAGCRVSVQIDGGRIRMRHNKAKGKQKQGRPTRFKTPWREPKLLTIFVFDQQGRMVRKERQPLIDGTLLGPDHLAELVAYHLHRLGVAQAEVVVFAADGAPWIWDRIDWIVRRAGLAPSKVVQVLDFCHASHHISMALKALGLKGKTRRQRYRELRGWLKEGRHAEIVSELLRMATGKEDETATKAGVAKANRETGKAWTEIRYLEKHGSAGRLDYASFRERGLPLGSGAIESTIRRVINLRLKSNAMYWLEDNAEAMFVLRGLLLSERWDETLTRVRAAMATDRSLQWHWEAPEIPKDLNALETVSPPMAQAAAKKGFTTMVA